MLSTIISNRAKTLLVLGMVFAGLVLPLRSIAAAHLSNTIDVNRDRRQALKGSWECRGTSTLDGKGVQPYAGQIDNEWMDKRSWLALEFAEQRPRGKPFSEQQLWEVLADGTHRRTILTNTGTWGVVTSPGLQGNVMQWQGPFGDMQLSETLTLFSANQHRWYGELTQDGVYAGYYELMCSRLSSR